MFPMRLPLDVELLAISREDPIMVKGLGLGDRGGFLS